MALPIDGEMIPPIQIKRTPAWWVEGISVAVVVLHGMTSGWTRWEATQGVLMGIAYFGATTSRFLRKRALTMVGGMLVIILPLTAFQPYADGAWEAGRWLSRLWYSVGVTGLTFMVAIPLMLWRHARESRGEAGNRDLSVSK